MGLEEGRQQGQQEVQESMASTVSKLDQVIGSLIDSIQQEKEKIIRTCEPQLIELACTIAGRIIRKEVQQDDEAVLRIVQQALHLANEKEKIILRMNPADLLLVREHSEQLRESNEEIKDIIFEDDSRVECGGCVIEDRCR